MKSKIKEPNIEEIMKQIREKIAKRDKNKINQAIIEDEILQKLKNNYDIRVGRIITSHRKIVGPSLVKIRKLLHEEVIRSIEPMLNKQVEFNSKVLDLLDQLNKKIEDNPSKKNKK